MKAFDAKLILNWEQAADASVEVVGGKGRNLGRLARYGLPVGNGFVISVQAYCAAVGAVLKEQTPIAQAADSVDENGLATMRQSVLDTALPNEVIGAVDRALAACGWADTPLAIRSSAPAEDSENASFAGVHDSVLNVLGREAVFDAVKQVWASLWTPRASAYRSRFGISDAEAVMAVVVMPMLSCQSSGVIFTCDPQTGREDRMVISAVRGLGEALVSGQINGEDMVLEGDSLQTEWQVISRCASRAAYALEAGTDGSLVKRSLLDTERQVPILSDVMAKELARLAHDAANALDYSAPWYDIEWVFDGARFSLVQARPVTARPWHTYPGLAGQASFWSNGNTKDVLPHVLNACEVQPLKVCVNTLLAMLHKLVGFPVLDGVQRFSMVNGRAYLNASIMQWEANASIGIPPKMISRGVGGAQTEIAVPTLTTRARLRHFSRLARLLMMDPAMRRRGLRESAKVSAEGPVLRKLDMGTLSDEDLLKRRDAQLESIWLGHPGLAFMQCSGGSAMILLGVIEKSFRNEGGALGSALLAGRRPSVTAQQGYDLLRLAQIAKEDRRVEAWLRSGGRDVSELPAESAFAIAFADFVDRYGHRGVYESYTRSPRLRERPEDVAHSVASLLEVNIEDIKRRQSEAAAGAWTRIASGTTLLQRLAIRFFLTLAERDNNQRELARSSFCKIAEFVRALVLESARRLKARGVLVDGEDIFHLTADEQSRALNGTLAPKHVQARISERKRLFEHWSAQPAPSVVNDQRLGMQKPSQSASALVEGCEQWSGIAIGNGRVEGIVRIIHHPNDIARLAKGEILVASSTDPAWVPLFLKAGGLVMETGGFLSHGAIVAREFGLPAIVNIPGIMQILRDGDVVVVDGPSGTLIRTSSVQALAA